MRAKWNLKIMKFYIAFNFLLRNEKNKNKLNDDNHNLKFHSLQLFVCTLSTIYSRRKRQRRASAAPSVCMLVPTWDDERTTTKGKLKNRISHNINFIVKLIMKSQAEWKQDELCSESCIIAFVVGELNWHFTIFTIFIHMLRAALHWNEERWNMLCYCCCSVFLWEVLIRLGTVK